MLMGAEIYAARCGTGEIVTAKSAQLTRPSDKKSGLLPQIWLLWNGRQ
jgi:hypothetical protein